ncbi:MAG TPA: TonB-dependent receptor, partial [Cytophagales bacterium]|nr:TonB-dependent receptor [Cytophagales bacterium]
MLSILFLPTNTQRLIIGMGIILLAGLSGSAMAQPTRYTLSGTVADAQSGETLIGANVWCEATQQGAAANAYGFYSLTLPAGDYELTVSASGYATQTVPVSLTANETLNLGLEQATQQLDEVVVSGEISPVQLTQMSRRTLPIDQLDELPTFFGEVDVLKGVQMMPGVLRGSEGNNGLYVRGGSADQNLMLLDGVPVYNANHVFGFLSVFNADAINSVELIKGGYPAR